MKLALTILICAFVVSLRAEDSASAPQQNTKQIINASFNFLKNEEPEMTGDEYALYEKAVNLTSVNPAFGLNLLETLIAGDERKSAPFELALGNVYFNNGKPELAEKHYHAALEKYPDFLRAWSNLAALLYSQGRYAEAIPCFARVVSHGQADAATLGVLAYCQLRVGNPLAAEMNYIQALGLDPNNPDWLSGLLTLALDAKQYNRAEQLLKQLVRLRPKDHQNWLSYAHVLAGQGKPIEAIAILDAAKELGYVDEEGLLFLGDLCAEQKLSGEAVAAYQSVLTHSPDLGTKRLITYAQALTAVHQLDAADRALAGITVELPPATRVDWLRAKAELAQARQDWPAARHQLDELLKLQPLDGAALLSLGHIYEAENNVTAATFTLEQAARAPGFEYRASLDLANIALKQHHYPRALELLQKAAAIEKTPLIEEYIGKLKATVPTSETSFPTL